MRPRKSAISLISVALFVFVSNANPTPTPMPPPLVQGVSVIRTVQGSSPALSVSWSAVSGSDITYTVLYAKVNDQTSTKRVEGITGTSTTLGPLSPGTTYNIWVRAESSGRSGRYNNGIQERTYQVPSAPSNITTLPFTTTLTMRWDAYKEFNYTLHVQKKGFTEINTFGPVTPPYNITGLESNTEYTVVVEAYNPLGSANSSVVGSTLPWPEVEDIKTNGLDADSSISLSAGLFVAGLFSGYITLLLVEGIIWGACKIRSNRKLVKLSEEGIHSVQMTDCLAYVSNDREDKTADEYTYEEVP